MYPPPGPHASATDLPHYTEVTQPQQSTSHVSKALSLHVCLLLEDDPRVERSVGAGRVFFGSEQGKNYVCRMREAQRGGAPQDKLHVIGKQRCELQCNYSVITVCNYRS